MDIRYLLDPETQQPHIFEHGVTEKEVSDILHWPGEDRRGEEASRVASGQTAGGRYLRVIYVPDEGTDSVFVITAYEMRGKPLKAYRRRKRRKK